jgi:hypothetical protein
LTLRCLDGGCGIGFVLAGSACHFVIEAVVL